VLHAIYAEFNARIEAEALRLGGKVEFLNEAEASKIAAVNDSVVERPWELWKNQALSRSQSR